MASKELCYGLCWSAIWRNYKQKRGNKCCLSRYSEPGSNRYGHYCPQDFKSGVSTYSTIRATQSNLPLTPQRYKLICYMQGVDI